VTMGLGVRSRKSLLEDQLMQMKPIKIGYVDQSYSCQDRRSQNTSDFIKEGKDWSPSYFFPIFFCKQVVSN
jgi:hypothetical protein